MRLVLIMSKSKFVFALALFVIMVSLANAQYWFQSGVRGQLFRPNTGAGASIETITSQNISRGSYAFWVGETLSNGEFLQVGYFVPNNTGLRCSYYSVSGCTGSVLVTKGEPTWFWEYFTDNGNNSSFLGELGGSGTVGQNGTFNQYSFVSNGDLWTFYLNGNVIGSITLGASSSGPNPPLAYGEYANAPNNSAFISPVMFKNFTMYYDGAFHPLPKAYAYVGYGVGSSTAMSGPIGVKEVGGAVNYFEVGSGFQSANNNSVLWNGGYNLRINSDYGTESTQNYTAGTTVQLDEPQIINISNGVREVLIGWVGSGDGSYTGNSTAPSISMFGNVTETALWKTQYLINAESSYGPVEGSGWYDSGSTAHVSIPNNDISLGYGSRVVFLGWDNGMQNSSIAFGVYGPANVTAEWKTQYLVNVTAAMGKAVGVGWYNSGSVAELRVINQSVYTNNETRYIFSGWSNGEESPNISVKVAGPISLSADYTLQYLVRLEGFDAYGNSIHVKWFGVGNSTCLGDSCFFDVGVNYTVDYAYYKNVTIAVNKNFFVSAPQTVDIALPVYNLSLRTAGPFGGPVNVSVEVSFKNGSMYYVWSGRNGTLELSDIPYGYAHVRADYLLDNYNFTASGGSTISLTFVTPFVIGVVVIGIGVVACCLVLVIRKRKRIM